MPEIDTKTCNQLLLHQFLAGLPFMASKQLCMWQRGNKWAQRNTHVSYLLFKDQQQPPASGHWDHSTYQPRWKLEQVMTANLARLNDQVVALSEQVEASCRQGESDSRPAVRRNFHGFHGFQFQSTCTHCKILLPGKLQWGACETQSTWENPWFCDSERFNTNGQSFLQFHGLMLRLHWWCKKHVQDMWPVVSSIYSRKCAVMHRDSWNSDRSAIIWWEANDVVPGLLYRCFKTCLDDHGGNSIMGWHIPLPMAHTTNGSYH